MEKLFDFGVDVLLPMSTSTVMGSIDTLQKQQEPPYSEGIYYIEVRKECLR